MIVEYYVTGTVTAGTNVPSLALLNCIASGLTAGRIAYNSPSNKIISSVMPGGTFFWHWQCTARFAAQLLGHLV